MTYGEKAAELKNTLNCAQSVVVALDELTGLDEATPRPRAPPSAGACAAAKPAGPMPARSCASV